MRTQAEARKAAGANAAPPAESIYTCIADAGRIHNAREKVLIIDAFFIVIEFFSDKFAD